MFTFPPFFPKNRRCYLTALVRLGIGVRVCAFVCGVGGGVGWWEKRGPRRPRGATAAGMQRLGVAAAVAVALWC